MAGEWIKMRASLQTEPKVAIIGKIISQGNRFAYWMTCEQYDDAVFEDRALRYVVTGALHAVWCAVNEHAQQDTIKGGDLRWIDEMCGIDKFGEAMLTVGWVEVKSDGLFFPKFSKHNTSGAERQKRYRENRRNSDVTRDVTRGAESDGALRPREEKRREEKKEEEKGEPPRDFKIDSPEALSQEFAHLYVGSHDKSRQYDYHTGGMAELIRHGITVLSIRNRIHDKQRDRTESFTRFAQWFLPPARAAPTETRQQKLDRINAERDERNKCLLKTGTPGLSGTAPPSP